MEVRKITQNERGCISNCIFEHWGDPDDIKDVEKRDEEYQSCLTDCQVCG
jgi:hypothetical protein